MRSTNEMQPGKVPPKYLILILLSFSVAFTGHSAVFSMAKKEPVEASKEDEKEPFAGPSFHFDPTDSIIPPALAIDPEVPDTTQSSGGFVGFINSVSSLFQMDTSKRKKITFLALPEFSYGDVDGIGLGFTARMYINNYHPLPNGNRRRQSYIDLSGGFTFKGNITASIRPTFYLLDDRLLLKGLLAIGHYPTTFRAIGDHTTDDQKENYDKRSTRMHFISYWRWFRNTYVGAGFHYYDYGVKDVVEGGMLDQGDITGHNGTKISGLSLHYLYDSRDDQFVPLRGVYIQIDAHFNGRFIGSSEDYTKYIIDARYYLPVGRNQIIAMNFYSHMSVGDVPFQDMALLSNGVHSRGYGTGRYLDKNLMSLQAEYRYYFGRFGVSAFASTANIGETALKALKMDKPTFGGGLRFKPFRAQRMYFRADVGFNTHGDIQFYLGLDELF